MLSLSLITISSVCPLDFSQSPSHSTINRNALFTIIIIYRHAQSTQQQHQLIRVIFATRLFVNIFFHSVAADVSAKSRNISQRTSSMSRRKQAKPQHLKSDEDPTIAGVVSENGKSCVYAREGQSFYTHVQV